jgi:hypothetical protein
MILASHGIISSQIASFDADAAAFFARVTAAGGSLSATEKIATNQLVLDLKANSLWTKMKAIYPIVGASAAACAQNLKSSSFTGTFNGGWTFSSTGATPNGTNAYMNTNLNMLNDLTQNSSHFSVYLRTDVQGSYAAGGVGDFNNNSILLYPWIFGVAVINLFSSGGSNFLTSEGNSLRFRMLNRISSSDINYFVNTNKYNKALTSVAGVNKNMYISAHNNDNPLVPAAYDIRQNAFASLGDGLTDTQASNFYTAVQAFQTTLSRNV